MNQQVSASESNFKSEYFELKCGGDPFQINSRKSNSEKSVIELKKIKKNKKYLTQFIFLCLSEVLSFFYLIQLEIYVYYLSKILHQSSSNIRVFQNICFVATLPAGLLGTFYANRCLKYFSPLHTKVYFYIQIGTCLPGFFICFLILGDQENGLGGYFFEKYWGIVIIIWIIVSIVVFFFILGWVYTFGYMEFMNKNQNISKLKLAGIFFILLAVLGQIIRSIMSFLFIKYASQRIYFQIFVLLTIGAMVVKLIISYFVNSYDNNYNEKTNNNNNNQNTTTSSSSFKNVLISIKENKNFQISSITYAASQSLVILQYSIIPNLCFAITKNAGFGGETYNLDISITYVLYGIGVFLSVPFTWLLKKYNSGNYDNLNIAAFILAQLILMLCLICYYTVELWVLFTFAFFFGLFFDFFLLIAVIQLIKSCQGDLNLYAVATLMGFSCIYIVMIDSTFIIILISIGYQFVFMIVYMYYRRNLNLINFSQDLLKFRSKQKFKLSKEEFYARFTFIEHIQNGIQASVFKYKDTLLDQFVAVKIFVSHQQEKFEKQQKELKFLKSLREIENTIKIYHYVLHKEDQHTFQIFLIMEYAQCTLLKYLSDKKTNSEFLTNEELMNLTQNLISIFSAIKTKKKIQHRDIKPSNILLSKDGHWKISDFGVSKMISNISKISTDDQNTIVGTRNYFSPQLMQNYEVMINKTSSVKQSQKYAKQYQEQQFQQEQNDKQINNVKLDYYKNDVFSLGLTLMHASSLESVTGLNKNQQLLEDRIQKLYEKKLYEQQFFILLRQMLTWDQNLRPNFDQLQLQLVVL